MEDSVPAAAGVDDTLGNNGEFCLALLRYQPQHLEGAYVVHAVAFHEWLWPAVRNALDEGDELADHATAQEQAGKVVLQRLENGSPGDPDSHDALPKSSWRPASTSPSRMWCGPALRKR